ncbi:MAG TPA: CVNH domain-containing protein [Candidatus Angelobacter sp.]
MRYLTMVALIMFLLFACVSGGAQSIPSGSYQQTCTDMRVLNNYTLVARCQDTSGRWLSTQLNLQGCGGEIINDNGSLRCGSGGYSGGYGQGGYWQGGYPPGDYVQTCRNIRSYGNTLQAECQKRNGGWRRTSLDISQCSGGIINNDGNLTCGYGYYRGNWYGGGYPPGDYVQTCRNIRTYGNRLDAECQKRNGGWRRTSLDNIDQCSSPIANDNGHLVCGRGRYDYAGNYGGWQGGVPPGTYTQTCRNIRTYGNTLEAECQRRDGDWRRTSLDQIDHCTSAPANDDGHLVCGR